MKKEYIEPIAKAVELKFTQTLLTGSDITSVTSNLSEEEEQIGVSEETIESEDYGR